MPRKKKSQRKDTELEEDKAQWVQLGTAGRLVIPQAVRDDLGYVEGTELRVRAKNGRLIISSGEGDVEYAKEQLAKTMTDDV